MATSKRQPAKALFVSSTALVLGASLLSGCSLNSSDDSPATFTLKGVVAGSGFVPGSAAEPTINPAYYTGATVCVDSNDNGKCDSGESKTTTGSDGSFSLTLSAGAGSKLIADIPTTATNTGSGATVSSRTVFRINAAQIADQDKTGIVLSPMSTEIQRMMEADSTDYDTEKQALANRVGVDLDEVLADPSTLSGDARAAVLSESNALTNRFAYAITKLDRGDLYPDALAVAGGDPELASLAVSAATNTVTTDTRKPITFEQAEQAAFNLEGIPRYDSIFIIMLENKATKSITDTGYAPRINALLAANNQLTNYYATGNPSEPNYTALGGADDFGITDDNQWNCAPAGSAAPADSFLPTNDQPGLASSPFSGSCTNAVQHNIVGRPNLFHALTAAGLTWRTYNESMNPGQDIRTDSVADSNVIAQDHVYAAGTIGGNASAVGDSQLLIPLPAGLYKTKHHPGMAYEDVRTSREWKFSNRTMGGGQWDLALRNSTKYTIPSDYDYDQLGTDLASGDVGNINFVIPDQCDDMHGITVKGQVYGTTTQETASDCSGNNIITRGDNYVSYAVSRIEASPLWKNPHKHVAIVIMFDEGTATTGLNSCCGWNSYKTDTTTTNPLKQNGDGTWSVDSSIVNYGGGNRGHGESIFGIITNNGPKSVKDSDAYSHFSFVRTMQDMFQLADPAVDSSYMNRSKYTEKFIAENIAVLPEFASSADTHFDAVRPINHAFVSPATYQQPQTTDVTSAPQVGPDASQTNVWAVK